MAVASGPASKELATAGVKFAEGEEKLPKVVLTSAGGSEADVYLYGGVITSWKVANGRDLLFVRPDAVFNKKKPIRDMITFPGFMDFVYLDAPNELHLDNGLGDVISIKNTNWTDAVLWNPYLTMEACYKDFVCVENARIGNVQLEPGNTWTATQHLSIN